MNCRVCLQLSYNLSPMCDEYRDQFSYITGVCLFENLEEFLCKSCLGRLMFAQKFREEAQVADAWFKKECPTTVKEESYEEEQLEDEEEYIVETLIEPEELLLESKPTKKQSNFPREEIGYKCGICPNSATFKSKGALLKHMQQFHVQESSDNDESRNTENSSSARPYVCEFCGQSFKRPAPFTFHVRSHTNELQQCPEPDCNQCFRHYSNMTKHFKAAHGADRNPFACKLCDKTFSLASNLRVHELQKHETPPGRNMKCPDCGKDFSYPSQLKQHMASHLGEKNFECKVCEKAYFKSSNLRRHYQNAHLTEYKKMVASGQFRRVKGDDDLDFKQQVQKDNSNRRHKCTEDDCDASFHQIKQLQNHLETKHSIEAIWACEDCNLTFEDLSVFCLHRKQEHTHKGPHICLECNKEFPYPSLLKNHVAFAHRGESLACEICLRSFSRMSHLWRHYRQLHKDFYNKMVEEGKIRPRKARK